MTPPVYYTFRVYEDPYYDTPKKYQTTQLENLLSLYDGPIQEALERGCMVELAIENGHHALCVEVC